LQILFGTPHIGTEQLRTGIVPRLTAALVAAVVERCLEALKQLKVGRCRLTPG